nr:GLUG motif-containing protein [Parabacteroides goldsteinii]
MKHYLSYIISIVLLLSGVNGAAGQDNPATDNWKDHLNGVDKLANTGGGNGTSWKNAIEIASAEELAYFAQQVNSQGDIAYGNGGDLIKHNGKDSNAGGFKGYYFALAADIDLSDYDWTPIGNATYPFEGNFDGRGHCVNGLKVMKVKTDEGAVYAGLFGYAYVGTLRNLGVRLADAGIQANLTEGSAYVGGIAGYAYEIFNCYVVGEGTIEASISGYGFNVNGICAGGIVGYLDSDGSLTNCYATVNVKVEPKGRVYVGGIVGYGSSNSTISCTYATGDVETGTGKNHYYAGGICGYLQNTLKNSLAVNGRIIGGNPLSNRIVGKNESNSALTDNYASPEIRVNGNSVSGGAANDANGNPGVDLDNFGTVITWGDGWNTDDGTHLPQLKIQKEGTDGKTTYDNWPTGDGYTSQPSLDATRYLIATGFADGNGDKDNPYKIANRAQLAYLAKQANDGKENGYEGNYFILTADIDLSSFFWTPIGKDSKHPFKGNFDGQGYCVKGLKVRQENTPKDNVYAGLFGYASDGTLCNLGVWLAKEGVWAGPSSESTEGFFYANAGGIAGQAKYVFNCYVTGEGVVEAVGKSKDNGGPSSDVSSSSRAGGIVGNLYFSLSNCYATVGVKASGASDNDVKANSYAGGIAGFGSSDSDYGLSQTYATGVVEAAGDGYNYAGGIYGSHSTGPFSNNLALNPEIKVTGDEGTSGRIFGKTTSIYNKPSGNYASPQIKVNGYSVSGGTDSDMNGDPGVDLGNFRFVITWGEGWDISGDGTNLPKLKMKKQDGSYESWPSGQQPSLAAEDYLPAFPKLHIVSPTGGTLTVKDEDGKTVSDDTWIRPGTSLTLTYAENTNYRFSRYLSGNSADNLQALSGNTIEMPDADLWLSADFNYQDPTPPPPPPTVYYTVSLPSVEGAVTDPSAGSYEVESWSTFCFYLMPEPDYSESEPVVTTSRGETIMPRTSDGAYLVKYVRTDVEIFIDGIVKNLPPVANEPIRAAASEPEIWSEDACLCIRLPEGMSTSPVRIFTPEGRLLHAFRSTPGLNRRQLPTGIYIVQVGDTVRKVLIK